MPNSIPPLIGQAPQALNIFVLFVQWSATILAALAGLYQARKYGMDFYGSLVIGFVVSVGGGTIQMGAPLVVAPVMGTITASFGGVLRDVFFARVAQSFMPGHLYAAAAVVGASAYVLVWWLGTGEMAAFLACFVLMFAVRIASVRFNIQSR